jgi:16S rRNA (guanine527-N7)-methyltransferase
VSNKLEAVTIVDSTPLAALHSGAALLGTPLDTEQQSKFATFLEMLLAANAEYNLTSVRDPETIVQRHFLESLALGRELDRRLLLASESRALDLGTGAGFPGIPLRLAWPDLRISLLEATGKKAHFVEQVVAALGLNATVLEGRAETLAREPRLRGTFDLVVARTVAALPVLIELALPFLKVGGTLAAMKGSRAGVELKESAAALVACGGEVIDYVPRIGSGPLGVVLVQKRGITPDRYPRRPGIPTKRPLGS